MPTASVLPPGPILSASVTLTSAQVLAIFTTPVTVVPAPGSGLAVIPIYVVFNYMFKTTAYTDGGGSLALKLGTGQIAAVTTSGFWTVTNSTRNLQSPALGTGSTAVVSNQPVTVQQTTANPTLGDGTVTVTVAYMVVPVS